MGRVLSERGKKDKLILYLQNIQSKYWELYSETNSCGSPRWGTSRKQWRGNLDLHTETMYTHPHKSNTKYREDEALRCVFKQTVLPITDWCFWQCCSSKTQSTGADGHEQAACREWLEIYFPVNEKGEEKSWVRKRTLVMTHAHATNALQPHLRMNQITYLDEYFS